MKRRFSDSYRARSWLAPSAPRQAQLDDEERRSVGPERAAAHAYWRRPLALLETSTRAAWKATHWTFRVGHIGPEIAEDVAQGIVAEFYALEGNVQPQTEAAFEVWAYKTGCDLAAKHRLHRRREISDTLITAEGYEASLIDMHVSCKPMQLLRCEVRDAIRMIGLLPDDMQKIVWEVVRSESVIGYAEDHGVSLFEAMAALKRSREIMRRLDDDMADERRFA